MAPQSIQSSGVDVVNNDIEITGKYWFDEGCDLVLLENKDFAFGLGMDLRIKTMLKTMENPAMTTRWSVIVSLVLRIGDDTLKVMGPVHPPRYWINDQEGQWVEDRPDSLGDFEFILNVDQDRVRVNLGGPERMDAISFGPWEDFLTIKLHATNLSEYETDVSRRGHYPLSHRLEFGDEMRVTWMPFSVVLGEFEC